MNDLLLWTPEETLLLLCARPKLAPPQADRVRELLVGTVDWERLLPLGRRHRVLPLLDRQVRAVESDHVSTEAGALLHDSAVQSQRQSLRLAAELKRILGRLADTGIRAIPLKGPVLAIAAYGDVGLRPFGDLDILVRREDALRAVTALRARGFEPMPVAGVTDPDALTPLLLRTSYHIHLASADAACHLEVHWDLTPLYFQTPLDLSGIWSRLQTAPFLGTTISTLAPEDELLYLAAHGAKHGWDRLEWVAAFAALAARLPPSALEEALARAGQRHCRRTLLLAFALAQLLLQVSLPAGIEVSLQAENSLAPVVERIRSNLFTDSPPDPLALSGLYSSLQDTGWDRIRYMGRMLTTPSAEDLARLPLPRGMSFLYRWLRPFRLLQAYQPFRRRQVKDGPHPDPPPCPLVPRTQGTPETGVPREAEE